MIMFTKWNNRTLTKNTVQLRQWEFQGEIQMQLDISKHMTHNIRHTYTSMSPVSV